MSFSLELSIFAIFAAITVEYASGNNHTYTQAELRSVILKDYVPRVRPSDHNATKLTVKVALRPHYLESLVESEERATLLLNIDLMWTDIRLTWDPEDQNGHKCMYLEYSDIWSPRLAFMDSIVETSNLNPTYSVEVCYDGRVHLGYHSRVTVIAKFHSEAFPFDRQKITVRFGHPTIGDDELDLDAVQLNVTDMQQIDDWDFR